MKRYKSDTEALVYAYGCGDPVDGWEAAQAENERAGILWDRLVAVDRAYDAAVQLAARRDTPALDAILSEMVAHESAARDRAADRDERREAWRRYREAQRASWPLLADWRKGHADEMRAIEAERRESVISERHATSAWWPNYNATIQRYETGRVEVRKRGKMLRERAVERDDGCLTYQIQRTRSGLGASPRELQDGTLSAVSIGVVPAEAYDPHTFRGDRRRLCRTVLELRVDAAGNTIRLPMWMHRPLPADCRVKQVQIVWQRAGEHYEYRACFTVTRPRAVVVHASGYAATVRIGIVPRGGGLQVATVTSPTEDTLIALDDRWMRRMDMADRLPSVIADDTADTRDRINARLMLPGLRGRLRRNRRETYRLIARRLAADYRRIVIETPALSEAAYLARGLEINGHRHRACAHELLAEIQHQGRKRGCEVEVVIADRPASAPVPLRVRHKKNNGLRTAPDAAPGTARVASVSP